MSRMTHTPETPTETPIVIRPETRPDGPHSMMRRPAGSLSFLAAAIAALALAPACGGKQGSDPEQPGEETSSRGADDGEEQVGESEGGEEGQEGAEGEGEGEGEEGTAEEGATEEGPPAAVTFVLRNSHDVELAFNMDYGWQPNLFAYTGKPPRAVSILMFPKFCTASCEASSDERCPVCEQPEKASDVLAAQKMEKVAPGEELEVPWDGQVFVYQKTKAGKARCECHRTEPAPEGTYTVKACGLRLTTTAEERSRLQCVEGEMALPSDEPLRVELDFGAPSMPGAKKTKKKKKR
jgi:hypothetical protein